MSDAACRVCRSSGAFVDHRVREMQFGTREEFDYLECKSCGSLQIRDVPAPSELARHYPAAYYSFATPTGLRRWVETRRDRHLAGRRTLVGALYAKRRADTTLPILLRAGIRPEHRIVDVGAGGGHLLDRLARLDFADLLGVDPFIERDLRTEAGVQVRKTTVNELGGERDVVMFNHSLEHVPEPAADLAAAFRLLSPGGLCIVRLPTTDSVGWQQHGVHWSSLDAPRHLVLPARDALVSLAAEAGFEHVETIDDSHWIQYLNSDLFSRDISPSEPAAVDAWGTDDEARYRELAAEANRTGRGDQAVFVFRSSERPGSPR